MTLVAIRHLPTPWNEAGLLQGRADIPITPLDREQKERIQKNRRRLDRLGIFDVVVCSTLRRTRQTAVAYWYRRPMREKLLDEFHFGRYEGRPKTDVLAEMGNAWRNCPEAVELGETIRDLEARVRRFIATYQRYDQVLLFAHGCWLRSLKSIHDTGNVRGMNRIIIKNNQILTLHF